jgi:hypothetical protein
MKLEQLGFIISRDIFTFAQVQSATGHNTGFDRTRVRASPANDIPVDVSAIQTQNLVMLRYEAANLVLGCPMCELHGIWHDRNIERRVMHEDGGRFSHIRIEHRFKVGKALGTQVPLVARLADAIEANQSHGELFQGILHEGKVSTQVGRIIKRVAERLSVITIAGEDDVWRLQGIEYSTRRSVLTGVSVVSDVARVNDNIRFEIKTFDLGDTSFQIDNPRGMVT